MVLRNVCGVESSTQMTQRDYDKLIGFFREMGMSIGRGEPDLSKISSRQIYTINQLLARLPGVKLPGVIRQIFGMDIELGDLKRFEAPHVISALQSISRRTDGSAGVDRTMNHSLQEVDHHVKAHQLDRRQGTLSGEAR
jgi:hypothetical protein